MKIVRSSPGDLSSEPKCIESAFYLTWWWTSLIGSRIALSSAALRSLSWWFIFQRITIQYVVRDVFCLFIALKTTGKAVLAQLKSYTTVKNSLNGLIDVLNGVDFPIYMKSKSLNGKTKSVSSVSHDYPSALDLVPRSQLCCTNCNHLDVHTKWLHGKQTISLKQ